MLNVLFHEVIRSLRRKKNDPSPALDPYRERKESFHDADLSNQLASADRLYAELMIEPNNLKGWTLLGDWRLQLSQYTQAETAYRQALEINSRHARAQEGLGLALLHTRQFEEAYLRLDTASKIEPFNTEIWTHWGLIDLELGNLSRAAEKFQSAIERNHKNPHAWHNLGLVAYRQGNPTLSIELIKKAIKIKPDYGLAYSNLALSLRRVEQLDEGLIAARRATELKANNARVWVVLADLQINRGDFDAAEKSLEQAIQRESQHVGTHVAFGKLHMVRGNYSNARNSYDNALRLSPEDPDAQVGMAELQLLLGEWGTAWDLHEARRRVEPSPVRKLPYIEWQGEELTGHRVLVHSEQGIGDIILFASCYQELELRGARCVLEVRPRLKKLFERSFPNAIIVGNEGIDNELSWLSLLPPIDRHIPFGSLPRWLRRTDAMFPEHHGYLQADPNSTAKWRAKLLNELPKRRGPIIGIAWRGGLATTAKGQRSLELNELIRTLRHTEAHLVCLQYGDTEKEIKQAQELYDCPIHPGLSGFADLDDVAALTAACDGIITVCSTQAHLTGALGKNGLILVPHNPSWRYGATDTGSIWYPSLQLMRQDKSGDWRLPILSTRAWIEKIRSNMGVIA